MTRRTEREPTDAVKLGWRIARVCPVTRKPWDEDGYCWTCQGIHLPRTDYACKMCGGRIALSGYCSTCREHGGGMGYDLIRCVLYACDEPGACEDAKHHAPHRHSAPVYSIPHESTWLSVEESRRMLRAVGDSRFHGCASWDKAKAAGA